MRMWEKRVIATHGLDEVGKTLRVHVDDFVVCLSLVRTIAIFFHLFHDSDISLSHVIHGR
jgi:hypothetical protein